MSKRRSTCEGQSLDRLLQPTVMALLSESPMHGYSLVERLTKSPTMCGVKPDRTGLYRLLDSLEQQGFVRHQVVSSELGPSKRVYELTRSGRVCLRKWINTLDRYQQSIAELVEMMKKSASGKRA